MPTIDTSHLDALCIRLSHERIRLANSKSEGERKLRAAWVAGIEKEIADEKKFLGLTEEAETELSDEELLKELGL